MKGFLVSVGILAALFVANGLFTGSLVAGVSISPYILQVICLAGINIILAVSLNLINGFTGQFSIGHAGFMAIGAYASAFLTVTYGERIRAALGFLPPFARDVSSASSVPVVNSVRSIGQVGRPVRIILSIPRTRKLKCPKGRCSCVQNRVDRGAARLPPPAVAEQSAGDMGRSLPFHPRGSLAQGHGPGKGEVQPVRGA